MTRLFRALVTLLSLSFADGFSVRPRRGGLALYSTFQANGDAANPPQSSSSSSPPQSKTKVASSDESVEDLRERLKEELSALAFRSERGFKATDAERSQARKIIFELAEYNPTLEPAASYYKEDTATTTQPQVPGLSGRWTLIYTDAPDITGLDQNSLAVLGRIGQDCDPPYIRNVIEWLRPSWVDLLPLSGSGKDAIRILQKVVTEAESSRDKPKMVRLQLVGLQVETDKRDSNNGEDMDLRQSIEERGILPTLLDRTPINLEGPLKAPFGEFEVLYLDEEVRIVRTGQNFLAVNRRISTDSEAWF